MKWGKKIQVAGIAVTLLTLVPAFLAGCGTNRAALNKEAQVSPGFTKPQEPTEYRILPGDEMDVKFFFNPELNETVFVRPDGKVSLQLVDDVMAAGLTPSELDAVLTEKYGQELRKPVITVIVKSFTGQRVYVGGEVGRPGLIDLTAGMTALQAVVNAGGLLESAKPAAVIVIRKGPDDRPIPLRLDLEREFNGEAIEPFYLQSNDVVYVPKTWIAKANKFIREYINGLLQFRGISLGFNLTDFIIDD